MDLTITMDEDSAALAIQLLIQDSRQLAAIISGKGKRKAGEISDDQLALEIYQKDLERSATIITDRSLTKSISRACHLDGTTITSLQAQEQLAVHDRAVACRLGGVRQPAAIEHKPALTSKDVSESAIGKPSTIPVELPATVTHIEGPLDNPTPDIDDQNGESSSWAAPRVPSAATHRQCVACQEQIDCNAVARVLCSHEYCKTCLIMLFHVALTDESLFPPRCCHQLVTPLLSEVHNLLPQDLVREYEKKKVEFETPDRTYCADPACAAFIPPGDGQNEKVKCEKCGMETCMICKAAAHKGDCPKDKAVQQVLDLAKEKRWQRCRVCLRIVELNFGCNHITYVL